MIAALAFADELARSGERPSLRLVHTSRVGNLSFRIRPGRCHDCRCTLARDERRCRRCFSRRAGDRVHVRPAPAWLDDFPALEAYAARSNWPAPGTSSRVSRARDPESKEDVRVTIGLTTAQEAYALAALRARPVRRGLDRWEWISAAWIELTSPPADVEAITDLDAMIARAVWRAEKSLRSEK